MANLFDYLEWRGDISFRASSFNSVDGLILSWLSYAPFEKILSDGLQIKPKTLEEIAKAYLEENDPYKIIETSVSFTKNAGLCLKCCGESERFGHLKVTSFVHTTDTQVETQFAAMCYEINPLEHVVVFRGTDETLVGWKEDFNMSFMDEVPGQTMALDFLEEISAQTKGKLYVVGHSKGGNLAVFAASKAKKSVRKRIEAVYNNDGPGFGNMEVVQPGYSEIFDKIHTILPEGSIVGILMEHDESAMIVKSTEKFINQHDASSWQLVGTKFVEVESLQASSKALDVTIKQWIKSIPAEERKEFIDALFHIADATNAKTTSELSADMFKSMQSMIKEFKGLSAETKKMLKEVMMMFFKEGSTVIKNTVEPKITEKFKKI